MGKKVLIFVILALTTSGTFGKISTMETEGHNQVKRQLPIMAAELRSGDARTAPFVRHTSAAYPALFLRIAEKGVHSENGRNQKTKEDASGTEAKDSGVQGRTVRARKGCLDQWYHGNNATVYD